MASKHIRNTNHNRNFSDSTAVESSPELESDDDTDQENFIKHQSNEDEDDDIDHNDFAIYTDDEDSPNFFTNNDEDIGLTVSEGEEDDTPQPHYTPSVINYMPSQSPEDLEDLEEDDDTSHQSDGDDSSIEQEEEDMIQDEFGEKPEESSDSEDDFYDFFEPQRTQRHQETTQPTPDEDDSYLWEYFFSSEDDEETPDPSQMHAQAHHDEDDEESHNHRHHSNHHYLHAEYSSGESTDQEDNLPIPSKRASNHRAVEVLGANSQMRPPVLGSWNIENATGNVGIIDGLTTRTLSPPPPARGEDDEMDVGNHSWLSDSDNNEDDEAAAIQMDEFINTDELDFDEENEDAGEYLTTPLVYRSRFNKNVPLSAFRNRSSPYHHNYDHSFRRRRRSFGQHPTTTSNAIISPVRSLRKLRPKHRNRRRSHSKPQPEDFGGENMLEFYEMGNMTPLFEI